VPSKPFKQLARVMAIAVAVFMLTAATAVAKPGPLYSTAGGWTCANGVSDTSGSTFGSASIRVSSQNSATYNIRLRGATPNTTYNLYLSQTTSSSCDTFLQTTMTTDARGNASLRLGGQLVSGAATGFNFKLTSQSSATDEYGTPEITSF